MKPSKTIYTIDARENFFLEAMVSSMKLDDQSVYDTLEDMYLGLIMELKKVQINYSDLKNCLTPQKQKREIALVFDSQETGSDMYGRQIMTRILATLDKKTCNSILVGDLICPPDAKNAIKAAFYHYLIREKEVNYISNELFFIVYINNLSDSLFNIIRENLSDYAPYVGYFDITYSNVFKHYLSTILIRNFIKDRDQIITPDEDTGYHNPTFYPFEDYGYKCKAIHSLSYEIFLSYKIERPASQSDADIRFSLNAISNSVFKLSDFKLLIEEPKLKYLLLNKKDNMERAGLYDLSIEDLTQQISDRLNTNYLFNLCFLPEYGTIKFNMMLEIPQRISGEPMKLLLALEYCTKDKVLRLITMF